MLGVVFPPALDLEIIQALSRKGFHKSLGELNVGDQGDAEVYRVPADHVIVGQLFLLIILGNVHNQIEFSLSEVFENIGCFLFQRPMEERCLDVVRSQKFRSSLGGIELDSQPLEDSCTFEKGGLGLDGTS